MILSERAIRTAIKIGKLEIDPLEEGQIETAHINLRLGKLTDGTASLTVSPKGFALAQTFERIKLSDDLCGFIEGRASLAKQGISVEQSSTFIEPGSNSTMVLEIFNASDVPQTLEVGQPIAKLFLTKVIDEL